MAAAIGAFGTSTLLYLSKVVILFWVSSLLFVFIVLGAVCAIVGVSLFKLLRLIRGVAARAGHGIGRGCLAPADAEARTGRLRRCRGRLRAAQRLFVQPRRHRDLHGHRGGFIAQATDTSFSLGQQIAVLAILLLTSKGGTTVAGGAFIKLAATLQTVRSLPLNGLGLLFGIDRLMATCTALVLAEFDRPVRAEAIGEAFATSEGTGARMLNLYARYLRG